MCLFFSLIPTTMFVVIGYFVLFSSTKAEGNVKKYGKYLAIWVFFVASCFLICGIYMTISGLCPMEKMMHQMEMPATGKLHSMEIILQRCNIEDCVI